MWEGASFDADPHLGASPRQLLFMSTPVDVLGHWLGIAEDEGYFVDRCFDATAGRTRRVYALEVRPGEAYVAPTECLVHDGSTALGSSVDVCLTMLSFFSLATDPVVDVVFDDELDIDGTLLLADLILFCLLGVAEDIIC